MPRGQRVSVQVRLNEGRYCDVPGCSNNRSDLSRWCARHLANYKRNGDPLAAPLRPTCWAPYRSRIRELYQANSTHPGLNRGLEWLRSWMAQAKELDGRQPWATEVARVVRHGCSPLDVLVELAACWCYLQDHPRATRSDSHRTWTLSKAVLGLAPRPRRITPEAARKGTSGYAPKARPAALKHVGSHLAQALAPLLANTHNSLQMEDERARAEVEAMREPFAPTPSAITRAAASQAENTPHRLP